MPLQDFHPAVRRWFEERIGAPSAPQERGWPVIRAGRHVLIAAPTGTGKTLAAFLWAVDTLVREGESLPDRTRVLYVSPLKALGNDVQKNLQTPLAELRARDPSLPEVRVLVRSGDTPASARAAMRQRPPHILVTTPESLYILLTSAGGREMLRGVSTVIVDEIHAVAGDKRGSHLALSLERLEALCGRPPQRIGLSATQRPIESVAALLVGAGRECASVDVGHQRPLDLAVEVPESPLAAVCSHETWQEIYARMAALIREHRTTLVFVNARKLAERAAARLSELLGADKVTSHHGSLSRERRLEAERRLKAGELKALVATSSLELGIDVGDVDLVIQAGVTPSIAVLLQRVGRSGHALGRVPRGRLFPLTLDELVCAAALLDAVRRGDLERTPMPGAPLDILAQQIVAACAAEPWDEESLYRTFRRAWPYRELRREDFDAVVRLHCGGRGALLHRDGVRGLLRGTRAARLAALTGGGAIPDTADYTVVLEPEATPIGTVHEDFAVEANVGDIFQLGNASWRVLKVEQGVVRVADAAGVPPSLPFWIAEAPARSRELSEAVARVRERGADVDWLVGDLGLPEAAGRQIADYVGEGARALGAVPTQRCVILERFFDEAGGMQLVVHAPFGGRLNRAWGLALRKRFCRGFGFELQAAANEEAIVLSLGPQHSFPLEEVFDYLHPDTARDLLAQAVLASPLFLTRWRWNLTRSLLLPRTRRGGRRVPAPLLRMRADDALARAFPQVLACGETLSPGDVSIPWEHPLVRQTLRDCLFEAMDADGLVETLRGLRDGSIRRLCLDTLRPSPFAQGILNAMPYAFLDDAPLEERRTRAVMTRRGLAPEVADALGELDPAAVARVRAEAWPQPESAEEMHEALQWMGYATAVEAAASGWEEWLETLRADGRAVREGARWMAADAPRDPKSVLRGRLEALGPVVVGEAPAAEDGRARRDAAGAALPALDARSLPDLLALEREGVLLRCRIGGREAWCERRLLARIHRGTLERLRSEIEPVSAAALWRFLCCWQHADEAHRLEGPRGLAEVVRQMAGFELAAGAWEASVLPARVRGYRPEWLDHLTLTGEVVWCRLWGGGAAPLRSTPLCLLPRDQIDLWRALAQTPEAPVLSARARAVIGALGERGALFQRELGLAAGLLPSHLEMGLVEAIGRGLVTCDSFDGLRLLLRRRRRGGRGRRGAEAPPAGRWWLLRRPERPSAPPPGAAGRARREPPTFGSGAGARIFDEATSDFAARQLLLRYGVLFKRLLAREKIPVPWRDLLRSLRHMELRGEVRGGRFVEGFAGEQYALPGAVELLRRVRRLEHRPPLIVGAGDPLNLQGILTPAGRVPPQARRRVMVG